MKTPATPSDEQSRINSLLKCKLLDSPAEERFDRFTRLATKLFNVPIALVSLVDEHRQWFKSIQGLDVNETGRDISFCGHTIREDHILEVQDTLKDSRFHDNPLVTGNPYIRFYAGAPIYSIAGFKIGTFCIIDTKPKQLTEDQRSALQDLAECITHEIGAEADRMLTEQALNESAEFQNLIFRNIPALIFVKDSDFRIVSANDHFLALYPKEMQNSILGSTTLEKYDPKEAEEFLAEDRKAFKEGYSEIEESILFPDGERRKLLTKKIRFENSEGEPFILVVATDISYLKQAEEKLIQAKQAAEAAAVAKSNFLANMSHEIRTPINGIMGMIHVALKHTQDDEQHHRLNLASQSASTLLTVINDILDFSKIEAGHLEIENIEFHIEELISVIAMTNEYTAQQKGLDFSIDAKGVQHSWVKGDPNRLKQVFNNLISNSIKFTSEGTVSISIETADSNAGLEAKANETNRDESAEPGVILTCSITDTGVGIENDKLEMLFKPFTQADSSTTRNYGGTGLGLSIVKQLCELMGGSITAQSELGKGSTFSFTIHMGLPVSQHDHAPTEAVKPQPVEPPKTTSTEFTGRVLLVEDNPINQEVVRYMLEEVGILYTIASNGIEALQELNKDHSLTDTFYDLILMDCQMPGMDGYQATEAIRSGIAGNRYRHIPIVALTANAMKGDSERCLESGMDHYLSKPIDESELLNVIGAYLKAS